MNRRSFMQSILAAGVAPYVITIPGLLMPIRKRIISIGEMQLESLDLHARIFSAWIKTSDGFISRIEKKIVVPSDQTIVKLTWDNGELTVRAV